MSTKHIHHDLIVQWAKDTTQVVEHKTDDGWLKVWPPYAWLDSRTYRIRHKHQDLIDQKAARPELIVEYRNKLTGIWKPVVVPIVWPHAEYRLVEPVTKKKVKMWQWVVQYGKNLPTMSSNFYEDALELNRSGLKVIQRADWTEIEVEVQP